MGGDAGAREVDLAGDGRLFAGASVADFGSDTDPARVIELHMEKNGQWSVKAVPITYEQEGGRVGTDLEQESAEEVLAVRCEMTR